jgi:Winged helix DNA-binding domain
MDELDRVLAQRLATQGLTSSRSDVVDVVRTLVCVQSQDAPLARWSLAMRTGYPGDPAIAAAIDSGEIIRTHILRPTWHYVLPQDLRWLLELTSPKVLRSMAARHRQLELDDPDLVRREHAGLAQLLSGGNFLTRRQIQTAMDREDMRGERLGHLLMIAELEGLICSGPLASGQHTYALVEERVAAAPMKDREEALLDVVHRFFVGHGPASVAHLARWTKLTRSEIRKALAELDGRLEPTTLADPFDSGEHWHAPALPEPGTGEGAFLLQLFDEAFLTYPGSNFPRVPDHPSGQQPLSVAEAGGGVVISDLRDVGWWKRKEVGCATRVTLALAPSLGKRRRLAIEAQGESLAAHTGRSLDLAYVDLQ